MNRKFSKKLLGIITGIISLLLVSATPQAAPGNGGKPVDAGFTVDLPAGFLNPTNCPFPIQVTVTGNAKQINSPDGFIITAAPQQRVVVTNLNDPTKTVSLNIQGAFHQSINDVGDNVTVITGRNLAGDPNAGLVLTIGTFSYILDSTNTILVQPLAGQGKLINVCELIS